MREGPLQHEYWQSLYIQEVRHIRTQDRHATHVPTNKKVHELIRRIIWEILKYTDETA